MNIKILLATIPQNNTWSIKIAAIMILCNILAIGIGRYAIQGKGLTPSMPIAGLKGFGITELLATTSLGHVIGAGTILGMRSIGMI